MALNEITVKEDLTNVQILDQVRDMQSYIETPEMRTVKRNDIGKYKGELAKKFPHLQGRYPQIFNMVMINERTFDIEKLKWMLDMLDQTRSNAITRDEADKIVAFKEFDTYIKPKIDYEKEREGLDAKRVGVDAKCI
jgi:hypothetical protein